MRDSLTVLASLLIVCLTAALVAPYFIDWDAHRALIERKLSEVAGTPVSIAGPIAVRLLPQPIFKLGRVTLGTAAGQGVFLSAAEVDVEVALTALMRGDLEVVDATLHSPRLDLSAAPDGAIRLPLPTPDAAERVKFQHVAIVDGGFTVARGNRPPLSVSGVDFDAEATGLLGPFKASGRFTASDGGHPFRLATGSFDGNRMRIKLALDGDAGRPAVDIDGDLVAGRPSAPAKVSPATASAGPGFDGTVTVSGDLPLTGLVANIPWRLTGHVTADTDIAKAREVELRAGNDLRALIAGGDGELAFGAVPEARLNLHGAGLDLDNLAVTPASQSVASPRGFDLLPRLIALWEAAAPSGRLPVRLDLAARFDTATVSGQTFTALEGHLGLDPETAPRLRIAAGGPDGARGAADGILDLGAAPVFRGRVDVSFQNAPAFAERLRPALPATAAWLKRFVPVRVFKAAATVDLSGIGAVARDLSLTLDRSSFAGTMSYTARVGAERARLFANLTSEALDLDGAPDMTGLFAGPGDLDLSIAVDARAARLATGGAGMVGAGMVEAGHLGLRLNRTAGDLRLDELSAEVGGATLNASGELRNGRANARARVSATTLDGLAALAHRLVPGAATDLMVARASALSPADLTIETDASLTPEGLVVPTVVSLKGAANGTRVDATFKPDRTGGGLDPATSPATAIFDLAAPDAATLLRQFGFTPLAAVAIGPGRAEATAHGSFAAGFDASLGASLGPTSLSFKGRAKPGLGNGHVVARSTDASPLLEALGILPEGGAPLPVEAETDLGWHDATLDVRQLNGHWSGFGFGGSLTADLGGPRGDPSRPSIVGVLNLDRVPVSTLLGLALGPPPADVAGASWSDQSFGPPLAALPSTELRLKVATLSVRGPTEIRNGSLILRIERNAVTLADLTGGLAGGTVGGTLTVRRDGPVAALAGRLGWSNVGVETPGIAARVGGTLDVAGSGTSAATLAAGLAGNGTVTLVSGAVPHADPGALALTVKAIDQDTDAADPGAISTVDADAVARVLKAELDRGSLPLGDVTGPAVLAAGVLRAGPLHVESPQWVADAEASLDLRTGDLASKTLLRARRSPENGNDFEDVTIATSGNAAAPVRTVDAGAFVNAIEARAIARDQERIDVLNQDIRERAFFNRQLKAIRADQERAREQEGRDRARAADEAARAAFDAERKAAAERNGPESGAAGAAPPGAPIPAVETISPGPKAGPATAPRATTETLPAPRVRVERPPVAPPSAADDRAPPVPSPPVPTPRPGRAGRSGERTRTPAATKPTGNRAPQDSVIDNSPAPASPEDPAAAGRY